MPFVKGWLKIVGGGGSPEHPIAPGGEGPVDPGWGIPEGGSPEHPIAPQPPGFWGGVAPPWVDNTLPPSPPGIWPPATPAHPIQPLPPEEEGQPGTPTHPIYEPGTIWPPVNGPEGKFLVVCWVPEFGWKYVIVDPSLKPDNGLPEEQPHPEPH